uniref:Prolactin-releasing peptide receptor-like n=1 Tax=Actinia tenebrosa TaxID=6105 RepID=A0A6P8IF99_ACTTE
MLPVNSTSLVSLANRTVALQCTAVLSTQTERLGATLANVIVMLLALVGNSLILIVVVSSKSMKNTTDIFIANMALSDLIFPLLVIPRRIVEIYFGDRRWLISGTAGLVLCKLVFFLQDLSTAVSIFSLILITIDRFYAIVLPLKRFLMTKRSCILIASLTWVLGIVIHGVYFESFSVATHDNRLHCFIQWDPKGLTYESYYISVFICFALAPFILMAVAYSFIFVRLKGQQRRIGVSLSEPQNTQRSMRQRKVFYLSFAIVISFAIAWTPLNTVVFLDLFIKDYSSEEKCSWNTFLFIGVFLAYASSAVNPFIIFLFSSKFRVASREIVRRIGRHYVQRSNQVTNITNIELQ